MIKKISLELIMIAFGMLIMVAYLMGNTKLSLGDLFISLLILLSGVILIIFNKRKPQSK
jgi:hypothetical protein